MTEQTNEALKDYLSMIAKAIDPVARAHKQGMKEVTKLTNEAFKQFTQYMGRNRQSWEDVTYNTLYRYVALPDQFALTNEEINKIVLDPTIKSKVPAVIRTLPTNFMTAVWAKSSQPIGGPNTDGKAGERAQIIARMIIEMAAIGHLDKATGARDVPDPTAPPTPTGPTGPAPAGPAPAGPAPTGPAGPTGAPAAGLTKPVRKRSSDPALDALYAAQHRLAMALYQLQGGTP